MFIIIVAILNIMKRSVFFIIFFLFIFAPPSLYAQSPTPAGRFAACDLCGYCQGAAVPGNWSKCAECLYGITGADPNSNITLKIDTETNLPPKALPGKMYTQLGCIGTSISGLLGEGDRSQAASSVIQTLLNVVFSIVGGLGFLSLLYGSFIILTSQANPERLNYGKRMVYGAIAGVIFSLSAVFLVNLLASGILKIPGFNSATSP